MSEKISLDSSDSTKRYHPVQQSRIWQTEKSRGKLRLPQI